MKNLPSNITDKRTVSSAYRRLLSFVLTAAVRLPIDASRKKNTEKGGELLWLSIQ